MKPRDERKRSKRSPEQDLTIDDYMSRVLVQDIKNVLSVLGCLPRCDEDSGESTRVESVPEVVTAEPFFTNSSIAEAFELRKKDVSVINKVRIEADNDSTIHSTSVEPGSMNSLYYESFSRRKVMCGPLSRCLEPTGKE
jgi:hypothetical protein